MPKTTSSFRSNRSSETWETVSPTKCGSEWGVWTYKDYMHRNSQSGDVVVVRSKGGKCLLAKLTKQVNPNKWLTEPYTGQMEIICENHSSGQMTYDFYPVHSRDFFSMKAELDHRQSWYTADCMVG